MSGLIPRDPSFPNSAVPLPPALDHGFPAGIYKIQTRGASTHPRPRTDESAIFPPSTQRLALLAPVPAPSPPAEPYCGPAGGVAAGSRERGCRSSGQPCAPAPQSSPHTWFRPPSAGGGGPGLSEALRKRERAGEGPHRRGAGFRGHTPPWQAGCTPRPRPSGTRKREGAGERRARRTRRARRGGTELPEERRAGGRVAGDPARDRRRAATEAQVSAAGRGWSSISKVASAGCCIKGRC